MIEKMNLVYVVAAEKNKEKMLTELCNLGVMHISAKCSADDKFTQRFSLLQKLTAQLGEYSEKGATEAALVDDAAFEEILSDTEKALERKKILEDCCKSNLIETERLKPWGDFSPGEYRQLKESGVDLHFYKIEKSELKKLSQINEINYIRLASVDKVSAIAVVGELNDKVSGSEFIPPEKGIAELEKEIECYEKELKEIELTLKKCATFLNSYKQQLLKAQNDSEFSSVNNTAQSTDGLVWLKGYIPIGDTEKFISCAKENNWAYEYEMLEEDDGEVPTKVKYNKLTVLMKPIFEMLGTVPGYGEYDISFWFLAFFTLFFAMIIGDAGYGMLFLIGAVALTIKQKKFNNGVLLFTVLSVATVIWGAVTGTWFGLESAMNIPFLKSLVIPSFANYPKYFGMETKSVQNSVMEFCFSIGVIQLALACLMNIRRKIAAKDLSMLADIGWLLSISSLYFMVLFLVVNKSADLKIIGVLVGIGFVLVVLFGAMSPDKTFAQGLKAGLANIFTVFLDTISAFGNIMSYIRLFAVGMASLAIAQSFNNMSSGFSGALIIAGAVIAILGHVMNIVMGFLSVVVHGVRLNLLEFSGQLGMEWSGTAYEPFCKSDKLKDK